MSLFLLFVLFVMFVVCPLVRLDDARHEFVAHDVAFVHLYERDAGNATQEFYRLDKAAAHGVGQVNLRAVARDNHLSVPAHTG